MFKLSERSRSELVGVKAELIACVEYAIQHSKVDFFVDEGVRTLEEQKRKLAENRTKTLKSKHLTGDAVDLVALIRNKACWEIAVYEKIADAMKQAAIYHNIKMRWGGAWVIKDMKTWEGTMREAHLTYIGVRRREGRTPFVDGPHFELMS